MSQNQPTITEVRTEGLRTLSGEHYRKVEQTTTVDGIAYSRWAGRWCQGDDWPNVSSVPWENEAGHTLCTCFADAFRVYAGREVEITCTACGARFVIPTD